MSKKHFNCPGEMTLSLIGGKWRVIVLWLIRKGPQRSGRIKSLMPGITATAFSKAVRELEKDGLIKRIAKPVYPPVVSYTLTAKGQTLSPLVKSLVKWGLENQTDYALGEFGMAQFYRNGRKI